MGCFLSSTKKTLPNTNTKLQKKTTHRSPPSTLPFLEKEEVKEILSETPIIINNPIIHNIDEKNNISKKKNSPEKKQCHNIHDSHVIKIAKIFNPRELSGSSRVGSDPKELNGSIRVGSDPNETTKELSKHIRVGSGQKDMKEELSKIIRVGSGQKDMKEELSKIIRVGSDKKDTIRQRSPAKSRNISPARKSDHKYGSGHIRNTSPAKLSGQIRNISPGRVGCMKNNGESSCRRSRSPVMCGDQINGGTRNSISRCPSTRKSGKSPGRVRSELGDRRRIPAEGGNGSKSSRENRENNNYKKPLTSGINESLENPLVSLECFIFI